VGERRGIAGRIGRAIRWKTSCESDCAHFEGLLGEEQVDPVENRNADIRIRAGHHRWASGQEVPGGGAFEIQSCWTKVKRPA
jgi:hypothetical protein